MYPQFIAMFYRPRIKFGSALWLLSLPIALSALANDHPHYLVTIDANRPRVATVDAKIVPQNGRLFLNDSASDTGLYHGWATFVHALSASDDQDNSVQLRYMADGSWLVESESEGPLNVRYQMLLQHDRFPNDPGDDELAYAGPWGVMWTGRALFISGTEADQIEVQFVVPEDWKVTTPWNRAENKGHTFIVQGTDKLLNSALMAGTHTEHEIQHGDAIARLGLAGKSVEGMAELFQSTVSSALDNYGGLFGGPPTANMVLLVAEGRLSGGGVMGTSISMLFDGEMTAETIPIAQYITSHEMYHLWNANLNYRDVTELYWFTEGFADYMTFLMALRHGVMDEVSFLGQVAGRYQSYRNAMGHLSLAEAGIEKLSNYDLVYSGGMMAALVLDLEIRAQTTNQYSLDSLHPVLYEQYRPGSSNELSNDELANVVKDVTGLDKQVFFDSYISGLDPLPVAEALRTVGVTLEPQGTEGEVRLQISPDRSQSQAEGWQYWITGKRPG